MTDKQKSWLLKTEREIRQKFPDEEMKTDDDWERLIDYTTEIYHKANDNLIVRKWLVDIMDGYQRRSRILNNVTEEGRKQNAGV